MNVGTYETRRCRAHRTNGDACSAYAIHGGTVCVVHGGSAPQVKKAAAERLQDLVDPAITRLAQLLESGESEVVKLATARDILDRAGYKPQQRIDVTTNGQPLIKPVAADDLALLNS